MVFVAREPCTILSSIAPSLLPVSYPLGPTAYTGIRATGYWYNALGQGGLAVENARSRNGCFDIAPGACYAGLRDGVPRWNRANPADTGKYPLRTRRRSRP